MANERVAINPKLMFAKNLASFLKDNLSSENTNRLLQLLENNKQYHLDFEVMQILKNYDEWLPEKYLKFLKENFITYPMNPGNNIFFLRLSCDNGFDRAINFIYELGTLYPIRQFSLSKKILDNKNLPSFFSLTKAKLLGLEHDLYYVMSSTAFTDDEMAELLCLFCICKDEYFKLIFLEFVEECSETRPHVMKKFLILFAQYFERLVAFDDWLYEALWLKVKYWDSEKKQVVGGEVFLEGKLLTVFRDLYFKFYLDPELTNREKLGFFIVYSMVSYVNFSIKFPFKAIEFKSFLEDVKNIARTFNYNWVRLVMLPLQGYYCSLANITGLDSVKLVYLSECLRLSMSDVVINIGEISDIIKSLIGTPMIGVQNVSLLINTCLNLIKKIFSSQEQPISEDAVELIWLIFVLMDKCEGNILKFLMKLDDPANPKQLEVIADSLDQQLYTDFDDNSINEWNVCRGFIVGWCYKLSKSTLKEFNFLLDFIERLQDENWKDRHIFFNGKYLFSTKKYLFDTNRYLFELLFYRQVVFVDDRWMLSSFVSASISRHVVSDTLIAAIKYGEENQGWSSLCIEFSKKKLSVTMPTLLRIFHHYDERMENDIAHRFLDFLVKQGALDFDHPEALAQDLLGEYKENDGYAGVWGTFRKTTAVIYDLSPKYYSNLLNAIKNLLLISPEFATWLLLEVLLIRQNIHNVWNDHPDTFWMDAEFFEKFKSDFSLLEIVADNIQKLPLPFFSHNLDSELFKKRTISTCYRKTNKAKSVIFHRQILQEYSNIDFTAQVPQFYSRTIENNIKQYLFEAFLNLKVISKGGQLMVPLDTENISALIIVLTLIESVEYAQTEYEFSALCVELIGRHHLFLVLILMYNHYYKNLQPAHRFLEYVLRKKLLNFNHPQSFASALIKLLQNIDMVAFRKLIFDMFHLSPKYYDKFLAAIKCLMLVEPQLASRLLLEVFVNEANEIIGNRNQLIKVMPILYKFRDNSELLENFAKHVLIEHTLSFTLLLELAAACHMLTGNVVDAVKLFIRLRQEKDAVYRQDITQDLLYLFFSFQVVMENEQPKLPVKTDLTTGKDLTPDTTPIDALEYAEQEDDLALCLKFMGDKISLSTLISIYGHYQQKREVARRFLQYALKQDVVYFDEPALCALAKHVKSSGQEDSAECQLYKKLVLDINKCSLNHFSRLMKELPKVEYSVAQQLHKNNGILSPSVNNLDMQNESEIVCKATPSQM